MKTYTREKKLTDVSIYKGDLVQLLDVIKKNQIGRATPGFIRISTSMKDLDIEEESLDVFLSHREIPDSLDNLELRFFSNADERFVADKHVGIEFSKQTARIRVSGVDGEWVIGKLTRVCEFLENKTGMDVESESQKSDSKAGKSELNSKTEHLLDETNKLLKESSLKQDIWNQRNAIIATLAILVAIVLAILFSGEGFVL